MGSILYLIGFVVVLMWVLGLVAHIGGSAINILLVVGLVILLSNTFYFRRL